MGFGAPAASLVEQDRPVFLRIKKAALVNLAPPARPAVKEDHRNALRVAAFLDIQAMAASDIQMVDGIGFDGGVEVCHRRMIGNLKSLLG